MFGGATKVLVPALRSVHYALAICMRMGKDVSALLVSSVLLVCSIALCVLSVVCVYQRDNLTALYREER